MHTKSKVCNSDGVASPLGWTRVNERRFTLIIAAMSYVNWIGLLNEVIGQVLVPHTLNLIYTLNTQTPHTHSERSHLTSTPKPQNLAKYMTSSITTSRNPNPKYPYINRVTTIILIPTWTNPSNNPQYIHTIPYPPSIIIPQQPLPPHLKPYLNLIHIVPIF